MKKLLLIALALCLVTPAFAQERGPEWGETPEQRTEHAQMLNLMRDYIMHQQWGTATEYLQRLITEVPQAHPAIYTMGIDMYKKRATAATDPEEKKVLADSLIMLHDKYIEMFSEKYPQSMPGLWNNRAVYTQQFFGDDKARVMEALRTGVEMAEGKQPGLVVSYFAELTAAFSREELPADDYLAAYDRLEAELTAADAVTQQKQLEKLFMDSGVANCENIERIQGAKIEADPENVELLDRTIALMNRANCSGDFYMSVAEKLYKVAPTAMNARVIAASYKAKGDKATAARYIQEALTLATTPEDKLEILLGIAADDLMDSSYRDAYNHARQASDIDPNNVTAHYLMAISTAGGAAGCSGMEQRAAYWLAYDRMLEARRVAAADESTKPEMLRDIENNLARFSAAFPTTEELFLESINEGSAYTVSCGWVSGRTTVRHRP